MDAVPVDHGPAPGPHHAVAATPARAPGSVRRTTSLDIARPDGLLGRAVADIRGQDVRTGTDGVGRVVDRLAMTVEIDQRHSVVSAITKLSTLSSPGSPPTHGLGSAGTATSASRPPDRLIGLAGVNVRAGFGRRLAELLPGEQDRRSLLFSALDGLGGAFLVSGYALLRAGVIRRSRELGEQMAQAQADVCIGWASGGPLVETLRLTGLSPLPIGPAAPVVDGDDLLGWHPMAPMATGTVRRRRRLDVAPAPASASESDTLVAQSHFRDSYAATDGEMVMHEYLVDARVDDQQRLAHVDVDPRVLPWSECPGAVPSAQGVVGVAIDDLPARVRTELAGATTCTHLNSTLRSLADLRSLARLLPAKA